MASIQPVGQPQAVYAGVPAGTYMAQPPWQAPIMCAPIAPHGHYMQHMPQAAWGPQPMMPQPVATCMPVEPQQLSAGFPHGVPVGMPVGMPPQAPVATGGYSMSSGLGVTVGPMHIAPPSTLPPLSAEGGIDDDMENDFPGKAGDLNDMMPIGGLCGPLGDGEEDPGIPEEMDDFLNILANGAQDNPVGK
jgi:hypothetical protein